MKNFTSKLGGENREKETSFPVRQGSPCFRFAPMAKNITIGILATALFGTLLFLILNSRPEVVVTLPPEPIAPLVVAPEPDLESAPQPAPIVEPAVEPEKDPRIVAFDAILDAAQKDDPGLAGAAIGFSLVGPDGEILYERNGDIAQIPASSLKTITTAAALEILGPDFRFKTRLGISAPTKEGDRGDLVLLGGGDPMLRISDLESWVQGLVEAGVKSVPGRVIGDGRFFSGSPFPDFWGWGDIGNGYGSPVSGLNLEHNRFLAVLQPGEREGEPASLVEVRPEVPGVRWMNRGTTAAEGTGDGMVLYGGEQATVMHLRGTIPLGGEMKVAGAVPDPEKFAAYQLRSVLLAAGIQVEGEAVGAGDLFLAHEPIPEIAEELLVHQSPPLLEIVTSIHATSDNHETECLYQMIGLHTGMPPDEAIRKHWEERGLDLTGLRMVDGSGLARADHITPRSLARLQYVAATGPEGEKYVASLLETMEGRVRFKGGAMSSIRSYAGLLNAGSGQRLCFALLVNHYGDAASVVKLQSDLFDVMDDW